MKRRRLYSGQANKAGLPPGTLVHTGQLPATGKSIISRISYSATGYAEEEALNLEQCLPAKEPAGVSWINVKGIHQVELIKRFGECYGLHPLVLEDIVNTHQRPKIEDYGSYIFIVTRVTTMNELNLESEQISLILGPGYVLSFQEGLDGDLFEGVRERLRTAHGRIRTMGPDYLCYALIDAVVDSYFKILENMGELVEDLEDELAHRATQQILKRIIGLKREIIFMRKGVWPLREVTSELERGETPLVSAEARLFFRDTYDHTIHVIDGVETFRDLLSGMLDLYMSSVSNRTNEIMKFLTLVGTIFLPLTFLVGVYGMNFKHMPELEWHYGYYVLWVVMVAIAFGMVAFFKRKRWL